MIYSLAPLFLLLLCLEKLQLCPITFRFNYTPTAGFHWSPTPAMLTGDWPHFVFMIANLKWTLSIGRQPHSWFTPQSSIRPANTFSPPFKPLIHLGLHYVLLVGLGFSFHYQNRSDPKTMSFPAHTNFPQGLLLYPYTLPFFLLWWMNGLHSNVRKVSPSTCCLDFFLSCHSRTLYLQFSPFSRVSLISLSCGSLQLAHKYAAIFLLKKSLFWFHMLL